MLLFLADKPLFHNLEAKARHGGLCVSLAEWFQAAEVRAELLGELLGKHTRVNIKGVWRRRGAQGAPR